MTLGDAWVFLKGDRSGLDRTLNSAERDTRSFTARVTGFFEQAFSFAVGGIVERAITGITQSLAGLSSGLVGGNAQFEQFNTQFQVLLGNAELANQRLNDLAQFGATTPFNLDEVVRADTILQGFGLHMADVANRFGKSGDEIRRIVGDVSAGTSATFEEIALSVGKFSSGATGEAIARFQELGIVTREQLSALGLEFSKSGELLSPLPEAMTVLLQVMDEKYGGLMDAQSKTFSGMLSNLQDWADNAGRVLGQPIFEKLKFGLQSLLELLQPGGPVDQSINAAASFMGNLLSVAGELGRQLIGDVGPSISSFFENLAARLQQASDFLRQLRDEIAGLAAGDILGELGPGLDEINAKLDESLASLSKRHEETVAGIKQQLTNASDTLGQEMADIAEKFGPKIAEVNQRIDRAIEDSRERILENEERFQKTRLKLEEEIVKRQGDLEEKLTELKTEHNRKRRQLTQSLMLAESEEEYLRIQESIKAEDEKFSQTTKKAKDANSEQTDELKKRLAEEEKEFEKQDKKLKKQRTRTLNDLTDDLNKVSAERLAAESEVQDSYNKQVEMLKNRLQAENDAFTSQQEEIKAAFEQQMADFQAEIEARATAIGTGPAAQVGTFIRETIDRFHELMATIRTFIDEHATELKGVLIGIGAILIGGGIVAGLTALAGLLSGISLPILAIVGAVALLYTAWTDNWFGIQEKTAAAWDVIRPIWETIEEVFNRFIEKLLPILQQAWQELQAVWREDILPALTELWQAFQDLLSVIGVTIEDSGAFEAILWLVVKGLEGVLVAVQFLTPAIRLWGEGISFVLGLVTDLIENLASLGETVEKAKGFFSDIKEGVEGFGKDLSGLKLPDWLTPGSPTPLENALVGIKKAIKELPDLNQAFSIQPALAAATAGGPVSFSQINNFPTPPQGFDPAELLRQQKAQTIDLLQAYSEG